MFRSLTPSFSPSHIAGSSSVFWLSVAMAASVHGLAALPFLWGTAPSVSSDALPHVVVDLVTIPDAVEAPPPRPAPAGPHSVQTMPAPEHAPKAPRAPAPRSKPIPHPTPEPDPPPATAPAPRPETADLPSASPIATPHGSDPAGGNGQGAFGDPTGPAGDLGNPRPVYPSIARRRGWQGQVRLIVHVNAEGRVDDLSLKQSSGHAILDESALNTVRLWRFAPAHRNGIPVPATIEIPIRFTLENP